MTKSKLPKTDSIQKLAEFWDTHDLTDFEEDLEEIKRLVFARKQTAIIDVPLAPREAKAVTRMAAARGISARELVRAWVVQKIGARKKA